MKSDIPHWKQKIDPKYQIWLREGSINKERGDPRYNVGMLTPAEGKLYTLLEDLGIAYVRYEHPPVYTVEEAETHWAGIPGAHCKNLFLRNNKGNRHYLIVMLALKKADLKRIALRLSEDRLSFASAERLKEYMGLEPGAVSPFGLIHPKAREIQVLLDQDLKTFEQVSFHPNINTATLALSLADFQKFLSWCCNPVRFLAIP